MNDCKRFSGKVGSVLFLSVQSNRKIQHISTFLQKETIYTITTYGSIFGKRDLLAIDHIMLALFWSYVPKMK